ncbi:MAG TPA: hypothetical protein VN641_18015 [Urbifossiella sp.]|nr:hypothetical protein [Urbifossiella sp.]
MDYHLQNLRSGDRHSLNPNRTLIGQADHADVFVSDPASYLAALIVRYPSGWMIHGLSENPAATYNGEQLGIGKQFAPKHGDLLEVGEDQFQFNAPRGISYCHDPSTPLPPNCFLYVRGQDGQEECRAVDHSVLFGRMNICHVRFRDTRLSRMGALLAAHEGQWWIHSLSKGPIGRNRRAVSGFAPVAEGDELQIGPLMVRVEIRAAAGVEAKPEENYESPEEPEHDNGRSDGTTTDVGGHTVEASLDLEPETKISEALKAAALKLDHWLKDQTPTPPPAAHGIAGWFGAQKMKLNRFWYDTPEATAARGLRAAEKYDQAFTLLDRAIRARPDSPELLRELYRLHEAIGLLDLCYRPLRMIEKLANNRGGNDNWVLETLARLCERLGHRRSGMSDRAIGYWSKLEKATGVSYAKERDAVRASRALMEGGFTKSAEDS